ncbi:MAG: peptide-methionine (S)-S-oxide reductase MsrA [Saprospiraceae bacterium]|nr:peptide-methionine (S)-S-oxide reductase MsrA [Saprospiraceae bacterium]
MRFSTIILLSLSFNIAMACTSQEAQAIKTVEKKGTYPVAEYTKKNKLDNYATAVFAGGCFWCTEAAFERIKGVVDVISGYSGGDESYPEYGQVGAGETGHAEAIYIYYDSSIIDYETLLEVFFVAHDPTTLNYQGPDYGEEYRSAIFYKTREEKALIDKVIKRTNEGPLYPNPIVTQVQPYKEFWVAEAYHQNYYELHPDQGYVVRVSRPKVLKVKKQFPYLIKKKYK